MFKFSDLTDIIESCSKKGFFTQELPAEDIRVMDHFMLPFSEVEKFASKLEEERLEVLNALQSDCKAHNWLISVAYELGDLTLCSTCFWIRWSETEYNCSKPFFLNKLYMLQLVQRALAIICKDYKHSEAIVSRLLDNLCNKWLICEALYNQDGIDTRDKYGILKFTRWTYIK